MTIVPNKAIKNISLPLMGSGFLIRSMASKTKYAVITQTNATDAKAPKVCALWNPKVYLKLAAFLEIIIAIMLVRNPATSRNILQMFV